MKWIFVFVLAFASTNPKDISKVNAVKREAEKAFVSKNYTLAASKYQYLIDSMKVDEDEIKLNLAHAHFQLGDTSNAKMNYSQLASSASKSLKSIAFQQLGVMSKVENKLEQALNQLKSAIKADPTNGDARYDYEIVKKLLEEQKNQQQNQENQDQQDQENQEQQNQDQENQEQQDQNNQGQEGEENQENQEQQNQEQQNEQEGQENEEQEGQEEQQQNQQQEGEEQQDEESQEQMTKEKLEEMGLTEEKAKMLLEAMRQNEIKYLQYQKRKATKRPPSGKPDW